MTDQPLPAAPLQLLHQDDYLVAIHKPPGFLVHRSEIDRHETRIIMPLLRDQLGERVFPVHRLDKPTSGVLLFARDADTAALLGQQFASHSLRKEYQMIVRGWPGLGGIIDHPLQPGNDRDSRRPDRNRDAQPAKTLYHRLATAELPVSIDARYPTSRFSLVRAYPLTGRRHQLRRHMKHLSHPIIGDSSYGKGRHNRYFARELGLQRLFLCATALTLQHPHTGKTLVIRTRPDPDFRAAVTALRMD